MALKDVVRKVKSAQITPEKREPLWKGPEDSGDLGGCTQSLIAKFLTCRERFRLTHIEGWGTSEEFEKSMEYGNMFHLCDEMHSAGKDWLRALRTYCGELCKKFRSDQAEIKKWFNVCRIQFPNYIDWWEKHSSWSKERTPLLQEQVFKVPYKLPNGKIVYLRGKWDGVDVYGKSKTRGIYLHETKTKGDIDDYDIERRLAFDIQTSIYLIAMETAFNSTDDFGIPKLTDDYLLPIRGVKYNVVRRPLSGGRGSIRQKKNQTEEEFYEELSTIIGEAREDDNPKEHYFFKRWTVEVTPTDLDRFKKTFLDPVLTQMCDWYDWVASCYQTGGDPFDMDSPQMYGVHWRHPYGVTNGIDAGYTTEVDLLLDSGNAGGLVHKDSLFNELK